jgi:hypothetical protein
MGINPINNIIIIIRILFAVTLFQHFRTQIHPYIEEYEKRSIIENTRGFKWVKIKISRSEIFTPNP